MQSARGKSLILHIIKHPKGNLEKSFTLIELLIIVAILGILAAAVLVAVNPGKRSTQAKVAGAMRFAKQIEYSLAFELIGQWDFDDSSNPSQAQDTSGNNNHGIVTGATYDCNDTPYHIVGSGSGKCALSFDGSGDWVNIGVVSIANLAAGNFTICAWFKTSGTEEDIVANGDSSNGNYLLMSYQTKLRGHVWYNGNSNTIDSNATVNNNTWRHGCQVVDDTKIYLYVDGALDKSANLVGTKTGLTGSLVIGSRQITSASYNLNGLIDEVRIYSTSLNAKEIQQLYAQTAPKYQIASTKSSE